MKLVFVPFVATQDNEYDRRKRPENAVSDRLRSIYDMMKYTAVIRSLQNESNTIKSGRLLPGLIDLGMCQASIE
jgi:hypothetical protein